MKYTSFRDLEIWNKGLYLAKDIYDITKKLPSEEKFGLSSQIQRAVVSVPSNIAEGYGRENDNEFLHFIRISLGSLAEVETQIEIIYLLSMCSIDDRNRILEKIIELRKKIKAFRKLLNH